MNLELEIKNIIIDEIAAIGRPDLFRQPLVGFSAASDPAWKNLKTLIGPWHKLPSEFLPGACSVISYFVPFTRALALEPKSVPAGAPSWSEGYQVINENMGRINEAVSAFLQAQGFGTFTIPATHTYNPADMTCMWSHRSAGVIAGLGRFGANRMVITEKGSAGRFCSVITTARLESTASLPETPQCLYLKKGSCGLCFNICPVHALQPATSGTGKDFGKLDKFACQDVLSRNEAQLAETHGLSSADTCGKCISVCPYAYIE